MKVDSLKNPISEQNDLSPLPSPIHLSHAKRGVLLPAFPVLPYKLLLSIYCIASFELLHFYTETKLLWIHLPSYIAGTERLPYQTRLLPVFFLWPALHWHAIFDWILGRGWSPSGSISVAAAADALFGWSLLSFAVASYFCLKLYRAVSPNGRLGGLALLALLYNCVWSYTIHIYRDVAFPYDLSALAFLTAGILYIYQRRFVPLAFVMFLGTINRETTIFLIFIFVLDALWRSPDQPIPGLYQRIAALPWMKTLCLFAIWAGVHWIIGHIFAANDRSETYDRFFENLKDISLKHLPGILNICGYLFPVIWLMRKYIQPARFGAYAAIFPVWLFVMTWKGLLLESRIHGEWNGYVAVASILILERYMGEVKTADFKAARAEL